MKLRKRFVAWLLTGVMAVSTVQFPVNRVQAEEIQMDKIAVDTKEKETDNAGMGSGSEKEHESGITEEQKQFSEEEHEETISVDRVVESDEQEDETGSDVVEVQEDVENSSTVIFSGNCGENGDNVTFVLDSDGLLTISGSGRMKNYISNGAPWYSKRDTIKTIMINNGVESIGGFAFYACSNMTNVSIPRGVKVIEESAFELCSSLTNVDIPEGVKSISSAFVQCSDLKNVSIPKGVENIDCAFWYCSNLTDVSIPEGVANMDYAFYCCKSLKNVRISEGVTRIGECTFSNCSSLSNINIPNNVSIIAQGAFDSCINMTNINIPNTVVSIEKGAFRNCSILKEVNYDGSEDEWKCISIGEENAAIENAVIYYNPTTILTSLSDASIKLSQESYTYDGSEKKPSVYVDLDGKTLTKDVDYTVTYSNNINVGTATVTITGIGNYTDSVIKKFTIEEKKEEKNEISLGDYIYLGSYYNQPILWRCVDKDENGLLMLSDRVLCFKAYDACGEDDYYHNDSWGYVRKQYGSNCWEDSSIRQWLNSNSDTVTYSHCPPSAERVYDGYNPYDTESGFLNNFSMDEQNCIKQVNQVINVNACEVDRDGYCDGGSEEIDCRSIYDYPLDTDYTKFFYKRCSDKIFLMNARQIRRVYNNFGDYIYAYPTDEAVQNNDEKSSEITSSMTCQYRLNVPGTIGASFEHVETVPANQSDPKGAYQSSGIRPAFYLNESSFSGEVFKEKPSNNNAIFNAAIELSQESYIYDGLEKKPSVRVNLNGKTLSQNVDYTVTYSNNINVGTATVTITGIGNYTGIIIKEFTIEEIKTSGSCGDNLTWVISGNKQLTLTISGTGTMTDYSSLKEVPWYDRASSITSLVIEDGVASIGDNAFADFTAIKNVKIPESVTTIGHSAFANMDNVEGIVITDGVTSIGDRSFYSCDKLSYVEIAGSVTSVGSSAFNACDLLKEVIFCGDAPEIGLDCFSNTSDLSIYYPEIAAGWDLNIQQPYDLCKWQKWDNTVPTRDIVLLLDVSGSMKNKTDKLKVAVNSFISAMGGRLKNTRVALVPYNSSASVLSGLTTNKGYLAMLVNGLAADGGTSYLKALNSADVLLKSSNARQKAIVMFSDGEPNNSEKKDIYPLSEKLRESYIIYTVGLVNSSSCSDVLKKVAGSDGRYFEADNIDDLIDAFLNVADEMDSTIGDFSIDETASGSVNEMMRISGSISLTDDSKLSEAVLDAKIRSIQWASSDQDIVQDSEISCLGINSYDNRSAELMISFTPHKEGKVTITGTTSNRLIKSCEVTIEKGGADSGIISGFTLSLDVSGTLDDTIYILGELMVLEDVDLSSDIVKKEINKIQWLSTNPQIAEVTKWDIVLSKDKHAIILTIQVTPYKEGTVTISGITANGLMDSCDVTISKEETPYYYADDMIDFLANKGTRNTLHYLCDDSNFTNSIFVYRNDADFSYQMQMLFSDAIYRGKDGWKDLFTGQTSVEEAEKILAAMLDSYRVDCEELSKAKTAHKYANMTVKAFNNFTKGEAILKLLKEDEIRILQGWMSEDYVVEKLLNQEYDKLIVDLMEKNNLSFNNEVNQALYGFMESKELADSLSSGLKVLDKGLNVLSITQDTFNKFYELESLIAADEMYCEMLLYLKENCIYSVVQEAAGNLYDVIQGNMDTIMQNLTAQVAEWAIGKMIDMAVDAACDASPVTKMIKTGFDWGVTWSNNIFHIGDIQQLKDSMRTEAYIGQCLSMWVLHNQTEFLAAVDTSEQDTAAKRLYYSLYMLWQTRMNGEKTLQSLMEKLRGECSESYTVSMRISKALESFKHSIFTAHRTEALIGTSIACPVDVEVYDKTGNLVLIMKDGEECNGCINGIYYYVVYHPFDEDYVKYLYFSENDGCSLKCVGGNLGLVDCSISGISDEGKVTQKYFENIVIKKDTIISIDNISMNIEKYEITDPETNQIEKDSFETRGTDNIAVKKIELSETNCEMEIGKQKLLTFIVFPENATNKKPTWYSDNNNVAVVNSDGVVTAISLGTSVITAAIDDISVTCKIIVTESTGDDNTDPDNPDKPLIGDVLPEDIPTDGKIPNGLWIAGVKDYTYNGKPIKPEVRVYDSDRLLKAGRDYTISYKNNTKANDASKESKAPAVVVKGKGNYTGTEKQTFKILPLDLNDTSIIAEDITVAYNKKVQKKVPIVMYNGKKLAKNKDFTVSYPDTETDAYKSSGTYEILLTARQGGNFTGTRTVRFTITNNTVISAATVKKIEDQTYTGKAIEPELEVIMKKTPLVKNTDYTVKYVNNIESGTATAILTGIGKYAGTKIVTFKIKGTSLKGATVLGITDKNYTGAEQEQKISVTLNNKTLRSDTDYKVVYSKNVNAGTATVTINGINAYNGTIKKTFRINAYDINANTGHLFGGLEKEIIAKYLKGGSRPNLELTFAGRKLVEGTDYTISYKNNKTVTTADTNNKPSILIKGRGNFKGNLTKTFTITGKSLNDAESPVTLTVADKGFVDKAGKYVSVPVLTDADGKKLAAGKDYEKTVIYTLEDGTELTKNSTVNAGAKIKVRITGKGAYSGQLDGFYEIKQNDFSKAKISVKSQTYTGKAIALDKDSVTVMIGAETLAYGTDYEIAENSYANNVKKGTASVTIVGKGNYGGAKTVKFKITARKLSWFWRLFG